MDSFGDHALTCPCSGDRTVRHNRIRDGFYQDAKQGNMAPEREKQGLLPGRPLEDGVAFTAQVVMTTQEADADQLMYSCLGLLAASR